MKKNKTDDYEVMTKTEKLKRVRALYITNNYTTFKELAAVAGVTRNWLWKVKKAENWDALKEANKDNGTEVTEALIELSFEHIEFWKKVKKYCDDVINEELECKKRRMSDMESLARTYQIAEERTANYLAMTYKASNNEKD